MSTKSGQGHSDFSALGPRYRLWDLWVYKRGQSFIPRPIGVARSGASPGTAAESLAWSPRSGILPDLDRGRSMR